MRKCKHNYSKKNGSVNYTTAEFAFELDIDIWERLFDYLKQHPLESALFPYLLGFENDERPQKVLTFIEKTSIPILNQKQRF